VSWGSGRLYLLSLTLGATVCRLRYRRWAYSRPHAAQARYSGYPNTVLAARDRWAALLQPRWDRAGHERAQGACVGACVRSAPIPSSGPYVLPPTHSNMYAAVQPLSTSKPKPKPKPGCHRLGVVAVMAPRLVACTAWPGLFARLSTPAGKRALLAWSGGERHPVEIACVASLKRYVFNSSLCTEQRR
jgi:hypothetical protein